MEWLFGNGINYILSGKPDFPCFALQINVCIAEEKRKFEKKKAININRHDPGCVFEKHLLQKVKNTKKKKVYAFQLECQVFQVNSITICLHRHLLFNTVTGWVSTISLFFCFFLHALKQGG